MSLPPKRSSPPVLWLFAYLALYIPVALSQTTSLLPGLTRAGTLIDCGFLLTLLISTWMILRRDLPFKSSILFCGFIVFSSAVFYIISYYTAYPFGELMAPPIFKMRIFSIVPWSLPLWWLVLLANAYVIASVLLVGGRKELVPESRLLIVLITGGTVALTHATWEPIAVNFKDYWFWLDRDHEYYGTPRPNLAGWYIVGVTLAWLASHRIDPSSWKISTAWRSLGVIASIELLLGILNWQSHFYIPVFISFNLVGVLVVALLLSDAQRNR
jgi:uncharacterized membrane protein